MPIFAVRVAIASSNERTAVAIDGLFPHDDPPWNVFRTTQPGQPSAGGEPGCVRRVLGIAPLEPDCGSWPTRLSMLLGEHVRSCRGQAPLRRRPAVESAGHAPDRPPARVRDHGLRAHRRARAERALRGQPGRGAGTAGGPATVAGNTGGVLVLAVLVALGLGTIVERSDAVFTAIKLVGALYLVLLGVRMIRRPAAARRPGRRHPGAEGHAHHRARGLRRRPHEPEGGRSSSRSSCPSSPTPPAATSRCSCSCSAASS